MRCRIVLLGLLGLLATAPSVARQPANPMTLAFLTGDSYRYAIKEFGYPTSPPLTTTVAGLFNDDPQIDVAVLRGDVPMLLLNPEIWDAAVRVPNRSTAIARLAGTAPNGRDELLAATLLGLRAFARADSDGTFATTALGQDSLWAAASHLGVAQLDGQHGPDIYGVDASGTLALILFSTEDGFAAEQTFPLLFPPAAIAACDLAGTGLRELVVIGDGGVVIHDLAGNPRLVFPGHPGQAAAVVTRTGQASETFVFLSPNPAGGSTLWILGVPMQPAAALDLAIQDPTALTAADLDLDGDDDLVLGARDAWSLLALENLNGSFQDDLVHAVAIPTGPAGPAPGNDASPCAADLDGDGDLDLLVPVQETDEIFVFRNKEIGHGSRAPGLLTPVHFNHDLTDPQSPVGYLQIELLAAPQPPAPATHLELVLYRKEDIATKTTSAVAPGQAFLFPVSNEVYETGPITLPDPDDSAFFWYQRYVQLDAASHYVRTYPAAVFALSVTSNPDLEPLSYLLQAAGGSFHSLTFPAPGIPHGDGSNGAGRVLSTIVDLTPIPDFEEDEEPGSTQP